MLQIKVFKKDNILKNNYVIIYYNTMDISKYERNNDNKKTTLLT